MGQDAADHAGQALRLLNSPDLRHHPRSGPTERRGTAATPGAPLNIGIVDYIDRAVDEVVAHAQAVTGQPKLPPRRVGDIYDWYVEQTAEAEGAQRRRRDSLLETHRLEHAIQLGDHDVVREHPCPRCGTWGLFWQPEAHLALCTNRRCHTPAGMSSTWTLARLAAQKIHRTEIWRRNAT